MGYLYAVFQGDGVRYLFAKQERMRTGCCNKSVYNSVKFETGQNLPPVLKWVTHPGRHKPLLPSTWLGVLFLYSSTIFTGLWALFGATRSYTSAEMEQSVISYLALGWSKKLITCQPPSHYCWLMRLESSPVPRLLHKEGLVSRVMCSWGEPERAPH